MVANQFGPMGRTSYGGTSRVVNPDGEIVTQIDAGHGFALSEVGLMINPAAIGLTGTAVEPGTWATVKLR